MFMNRLEDYLFYVVTKPYAQNSAGIRAKFILNDLLLELGCDSQLIPFHTSFYNHNRFKRHGAALKNGVKIVAIYDESVFGNPLNAHIVIRWFLNRPGVISNAGKFNTAEELQYVFANEINPELKRLAVNTVDFDFFHNFKSKSERNLKLFYAGKLRSIGKVNYVPKGVTEIHRNGKLRQTKKQLRNLFYEAKVLYLAEDSAISLEAAICGCPTVYVYEYFKDEVLNQDRRIGIAKDDSELELEKGRLDTKRIVEYINKLEVESYSEILEMIMDVLNYNLENKHFSKPKYKIPLKDVFLNKFYLLKVAFGNNKWHGVLGLVRTFIKAKVR